MRPNLPAEKEYFTIGEISRLTGVKTHVLRYWESRFGLLRPARRASGQRRYSRRDVDSVLRIRELLYSRRYTIEGAKKQLRSEEKRGPVQMALGFTESQAALDAIKDLKKEVAEIVESLKKKEFSPAANQ